jgi:autotransporter-associated beta strand protein
MAALSLGVLGIRAQSYTWTGGGPGTDWSTANNWDIGVPAQGLNTNVFFGPNNATAFTSTLDSNYTIGTATVTAGAGPFTLKNAAASVLTIDTTFWNYSPNPVAIDLPLAGGGVLFLAGTGTLTLDSVSNTYSGLTRLTNGTLADGAANAYSPNSVVTIANPGILKVNFNETIAGLSDDFSGGNGSVVLANNTTLKISGNNFTTFSGAITGLGGIEMDVGGALTLSGPNTYSGNTTLNAGILSDLISNSFSPNSLYVLSGSANLDVNDTEVVGGLQGAGGTVNIGSDGSLTDTTALNPVFSGTINGPGGLVISGTGTQTLSGMSTYSGGTTVQSELFVGSSTNGPPSSFTAGPVGTGPLTFIDTAEFSPSANVTIANPIFFNDDVQYVDNDDGGNFNMTLTGLIQGSSGFAWCTPGTLELSGANTFTGGVDMREGTLLLGISTVGPAGNVTSGPIGTGGLILDTGTVLASAIPSATFANAITLTGNAQIGAGPSDNTALNITGQIGGAAILTYSGGPTGSLTLSNANSYIGDTMILGGTLVAANTQAFGYGLNNVVLNGGGLDVASGVTISNNINSFGTANPVSGSGTIATLLNVDNTVLLSPGDPLGTLNFSAGLKLAPSGSMTFKLYDANGAPGVGFGAFNVTGGILNITATSGTFTFNVNTIDALGNPAGALNFNSSNSYSWMFGTAANPIAGFNSADFTINTSGFANATNGGFFSLSNTGNNLFLNFTPIPEPTTWAMLGLGIAAVAPFAISRRRRRRFRA